MPAHNHPGFAGFDKSGPVHVESNNGGATGRRNSDNPVPFLCPPEMVAPELRAGIKEAEDLSGDCVQGANSVHFMIVAQRTGEPEVFVTGLAAQRSRIKVI